VAYAHTVKAPGRQRSLVGDGAPVWTRPGGALWWPPASQSLSMTPRDSDSSLICKPDPESRTITTVRDSTLESPQGADYKAGGALWGPPASQSLSMTPRPIPRQRGLTKEPLSYHYASNNNKAVTRLPCQWGGAGSRLHIVDSAPHPTPARTVGLTKEPLSYHYASNKDKAVTQLPWGGAGAKAPWYWCGLNRLDPPRGPASISHHATLISFAFGSN
jgi:hypothetical protein